MYNLSGDVVRCFSESATNIHKGKSVSQADLHEERGVM